MSNALIVQVADAIQVDLAAHAFSQAFVPAVLFKPEFSTIELATLRVSIVPSSNDSKLLVRAKTESDFVIDVAVQKKISDEDVDVRAMLFLVDEIETFLTTKKLTTLPTVTWIGATNKPVYSTEHLRQEKVFTSVLQVTYRALR